MEIVFASMMQVSNIFAYIPFEIKQTADIGLPPLLRLLH